jgi:hypothetical protein
LTSASVWRRALAKLPAVINRISDAAGKLPGDVRPAMPEIVF